MVPPRLKNNLVLVAPSMMGAANFSCLGFHAVALLFPHGRSSRVCSKSFLVTRVFVFLVGALAVGPLLVRRRPISAGLNVVDPAQV